MRRQLPQPAHKDNSCSTLEQSPPHCSHRHNKQKSQLCKKFMQFGYCPYHKKCKFAHGCHQLRKNQGFNSKYKTKQCGVFMKEGVCMYGERCNFIHKQLRCIHEKRENFDEGFMEVRAGGRLQSRLMDLLQQ